MFLKRMYLRKFMNWIIFLQKKLLAKAVQYPEDVLWYPNSITFFLQLAWKFISRIFRLSGLWNDQWEKCLWVHESESVSLYQKQMLTRF